MNITFCNDIKEFKFFYFFLRCTIYIEVFLSLSPVELSYEDKKDVAAAVMEHSVKTTAINFSTSYYI
jgi:hypothetical protein